MVTSQKILVIEMGNRGSKSDNLSVKEQRVDGSSIREPTFVRSRRQTNGKVYSSRRESRFLKETK